MKIAQRSGLENWHNRIFVFWFGSSTMSDQRARCFESLKNTECEIEFVDKHSLEQYILPGHPLHRAFAHLSPVHQSDYLRAYFMHHFGGGYSDIKMTSQSWRPAFDALGHSDAFGAGYQEVFGGMARFHKNRVKGHVFYLGRRLPSLVALGIYKHHKRNRKRAIGNGAFIFRPGTMFTSTWLSHVETRLTLLYPLLLENPAKNAKERPGEDYGDGPSRYPVPWSFLLGDILGPLSIKFSDRLLQVVPAPSFVNYE